MPLSVIACCSYLAGEYRPGDTPEHVWHSCKFVKAVKGEPFSGYAWIRVRNRKRKLEPANQADATTWAGILLADQLSGNKLPTPFSLVPIPNSAVVASSKGEPRTLALANAIDSALDHRDVSVLDTLRWRRAWGSAHKGAGSRNAVRLYSNLVLREQPSPNSRIVLVDDVLTSGAHMQAAAAILRDECHANILAGVVVGRVVHDDDVPNDCLAPRVEELDDWEP